jgi:hypothetical protein
MDAAVQPADSSPDIASLTGGLPPSTSSAISDLTKLKKQQVGEETRVIGEQDSKIAKDQARVEAAFKAEGVGAEELKPWDADKQHKRFESNPIEGIGSFGSLFAIAAAAFTKAPATNAMLGMAGAINAIKEGNEAAYQRAYESWKENTKLAEQRHKLMHEQYQDATSLMQTNMAAGSAKLHNLAVKFGDQNALMFLEHGMNKELFEMMSSRDKAMTEQIELSDKVTQHTFQKLAIDAITKDPPHTGDAVADKIQLAAQIQRIMDPGAKQGTAEQEAVGRYVMLHMDESPVAFAEGLAEIHRKFSEKGPNIEGYQQAKRTWEGQHPGEVMPAEEDAKLLQQFALSPQARGGAGGTGSSSQALKFKAIQEIQAKHAAEGKPISIAEAEHEYNLTRSTPSGNRVDDLQGKIDQTDNILTGIDKQLDTLNRIKGVSGLAGKIMRGEEIVGNIAGTTDTDRVEFRRKVHELQEIVPRILTDSSGRPLKSAQDKVDDIVAGLNAGDTGPNTIRAYEELREEIKKRQGDYKNRKGGTASTPGASEPAATGGTDWLNAYPEKQ